MIDSVTNWKNIRRENLPYVLVWIFYYAWVIVFTTWWTSSPLTDAIYSDAFRRLLHSVNLLASAVLVLILKKEWYAAASRIGAVLLALTATVFLFVPLSGRLSVAVMVLMGIMIGCVNICILMPFVFLMNNTEKFYSVLCSNLLICVLVLMQALGILNVTNGMLPSYFLLLFSLGFVIFFRPGRIEASAPANPALIPKTKKAVYITLVINIMYAVFCKGIGRVFLSVAGEKAAFGLDHLFYMGGILGCGLYFLIYRFVKKSNHTTWNVTFGTFICAMFLFLAGSGNRLMYVVFALLLGIGSSMGMINMYYILGVIGKKYWSMGYVRASIIFIGIAGGVAGIALGNMVGKYSPEVLIVLAALSGAVFVVFLALSPALSQSYFSDDWASDSRLPEIDNERLHQFKKYKLTKREGEVCRLLLEGCTLRQISAILGIAYPTVNTYSTKLYRKLGINSRTELLALFGNKTAGK